MAIYRSIHVSFWTDTKIAVEFTPKERYFYLYLLTNPHTNICGCYEISVKQIAAETGLRLSEAKSMLGRLVNVYKVIEYDERTRELFILRWHNYNWNRSPNCRKAIDVSLKEIKNTGFAEKIKELARGLQGGGSHTVTVTVTEAVPVPDPVTDTDPVSEAEAAVGGMTLRSFPTGGEAAVGGTARESDCADDIGDDIGDDWVSVLDMDRTPEELREREEWLKNYIAEVRRLNL